MKQAAAGTWEQAQLASSPMITRVYDLFLAAADVYGEHYLSPEGRFARENMRALEQEQSTLADLSHSSKGEHRARPSVNGKPSATGGGYNTQSRH